VNGLNKALLGGVSVLALSAFGAPVFGQTDNNNNNNNAVETVVVTGIRQSIATAQNEKRNSDIIQDSISAEDIGALPDRSVTEALRRIPGVSINYFAGAYDPDHFSAEGSGVIIRGLSDVQSLFNDRDTFTANNGRILSFADVPPELLAGVDVYKSPEADMIEGGIGGTVNLRTRVPFDQNGQLISFDVDTTTGSLTNKYSFNGAGLYSNTWDTPIGEFGGLVEVSRSELFTTSYGSQIAAWGPVPDGTDGCTDSTCYAPTGGDVRTQNYDHTRMGFAAAGQWKSNDDTMLATVQFIRSDSTENWNEHAFQTAADVVNQNTGVANPVANVNPVPGTTWQYGGGGLFTNGMITVTPSNYGGWRSADPTVPAFGVETDVQARGVIEEFITNDMSGHFRWTPTDKWDVEFDAQHVWSSTDDLDVTAWMETFATVDIQQRGGSWDNIPAITFLPPTNNASGSADPMPWFSDPGNYFWRAAMDHIEHSSGDENAFRADSEYQINSPWLDSIKFGARYSDREQDVRYTTYNWGVISEIWNGSTGPVWLGQNNYSSGNCSSYYGGSISQAYLPPAVPAGSPGCGNPYSGNVTPGMRNPNMVSGGNLASPYAFNNFQEGSVPEPLTGLYYTANPAANYSAFVKQMEALEAKWPNSAVASGATCANHGFSGTGSSGWFSVYQSCAPIMSGSPFEQEDVSPVSDKRTSAYAMLRFGSENLISGNVGLRWIHSDEASSGELLFPTDVGAPLEGISAPAPLCSGMGTPPEICQIYATNPAAANKIIQFCAPAQLGLVDKTTGLPEWACTGGSQQLSGKNSFDEYLPSLNAKVHLEDDMFVRIGASQSVTYPDMGLLRDYAGITLNSPLTVGAPFTVNIGSTGNPDLKPTKSTNFDVSYEWYFDPTGLLAVAPFFKKLDGVITDEFQNVAFTNNNQTFDIVTQRPANATTTGHIYGFEFTYNQFYNFLPDPFDGLGLNFNYTMAISGGIAPLNLNAGSVSPGAIPGEGCGGSPACIANFDYSKLPLEQISKHNINITGIYAKGPWEARLAYNWRSRFLLTTRDVIYPFAPIFNEPTGTLDASLFYAINDNVKIGIQGENLTNEVVRTSQVINAEMQTAPRSWFTTDRRFSFIVRTVF
jgi:TonB-dependent receptor